jgi:hypothetical protein
MSIRTSAARCAIVTAAGVILSASPASGQRLSSAGDAAGDPPIVIVTGGSAPAAPRSSTRWQPLARQLSSQAKASIVGRAFPRGLPAVQTTGATVDPTGLSKQVVLDPVSLYDAAHTAALMLFGADYRPPMGLSDFGGDIIVGTDARFTVSYRPAKMGAPVMIECQLEGGATATHLQIKPYDQSAAVASDVYVVKQKTLAFVVLPTKIGWTAVSIRVKTGGVKLHACAVTPLS